MFSVKLKLTSTGGGSGPFDIYSLDSNYDIISLLKSGVTSSVLLTNDGLNIFNIPDTCQHIKIVSNNALCKGNDILTL